MRRVAVIADVHGNAPALAAVLDEIAAAGVELVVDCGDLANGPLPRETLALVAALATPLRMVRGNGDSEVLAPNGAEGHGAAVAAFTAARLDAAGRTLLARSESEVMVEIDGLGAVCFCHGTPGSETEMLTPGTPEAVLAAVLARRPQAVVVCGHTHMQFDRRVDGGRVVNPGSVGMPYEGRPGAYWALLGPDVELRRTSFDLDAAAAAIAASGYPDADGFIAENLREPPGPDVVVPIFERQAGR